jgi:Holliday junction resolvasome RuvABC endonuclease subunit
LRECIQVYKPDCLAFESPLIMMGAKDQLAAFTTAQTMRLQISLAAEVETTAKECGVRRILEVATASAKVALAGSARLGKEKKRAMVAAAYHRGWHISDDHQADAGAVAIVAYDHFSALGNA